MTYLWSLVTNNERLSALLTLTLIVNRNSSRNRIFAGTKSITHLFSRAVAVIYEYGAGSFFVVGVPALLFVGQSVRKGERGFTVHGKTTGSWSSWVVA
jgi:hypothetical protein